MKKLKLQSLGLSLNDLLTREQLKTIYGASGSGGNGSGDRMYRCCLNNYPDVCNECTYVPSGSTIVCPSGSSLKKC